MAGKIRAAIFDMDGTLVDNMHFHQQAWFSFLEDQGLNVTLEEYHAKNAGILPEIMARFFPDVSDVEALYALGRKKEEKYQEIYRPHIKALPGLESFLSTLRQAGVKIGLATAADRGNIDFTLEALGIREHFDVIIGAEEVSKGKPDPEVFLVTAQNLGVEPDTCVAFEDSHPGLRSALAAGMRVVGLATTHTNDELSIFPLHAIINDYNVSDPVGFLNQQT
jgi:beta-phosphoglucomutase family hydrolase